MKSLLVIVMALLMAASLSAVAHAYTADVGNRAQDFGGWDIVGQRSVHLDDYFGQWVLVDFWGSWCPPCRRELPNLIMETRPYRDSGKLALISIACDTADTLSAVRKLIKQQGIDYPVLYDGGMGDDNLVASEWGVRGFPSAFLISPQGVIVSNHMAGKLLAPSLKYFIDEGHPGIGLSTSWRQAEDGSLQATVLVYSPEHAPVEFSLDRLWETWHFDPADPLRIATDVDRQHEVYFSSRLEFNEFGEWVGNFSFSLNPEIDIAGYRAYVVLPGTEAQDLSPRFKGIRLFSGPSQAIKPGIDYVDGHLIVRPD